MSKFVVKREEKPVLSTSKYRNVRLEPLLATPPSKSMKTPHLTSKSVLDEQEEAFKLRRSVSRPTASLPKSAQNLRLSKLWVIIVRRYLKSVNRAVHQILIDTQEFKLSQIKELEQARVLKVRNAASLRIQSYWRALKVRKQFKFLIERKKAVVKIQAWWRAIRAREEFREIKMRNRASVLIQSFWKAWKERSRYSQLQNAVKTVKNIWINMTRNRKEFKKIRQAAKLISAVYR